MTMVPLPLEQLEPVTSPDSCCMSTGTAGTAGGVSQLSQLGQDVLSVTAGEPATHINLDQLLSIVQSFQLDTTHAGQPEASNKVQVISDTFLF